MLVTTVSNGWSCSLGTQETQTPDCRARGIERGSARAFRQHTLHLLQSIREVIQCINRQAARMFGLLVYVNKTPSSSFCAGGTSLPATASLVLRTKSKELHRVMLRYIYSEINANVYKETTSIVVATIKTQLSVPIRTARSTPSRETHRFPRNGLVWEKTGGERRYLQCA